MLCTLCYIILKLIGKCRLILLRLDLWWKMVTHMNRLVSSCSNKTMKFVGFQLEVSEGFALNKIFITTVIYQLRI